MSALPLVNAELTLIEGGGSSEDYDHAAGADTERWAGATDAYVREQLLTNVNGDQRDEVKATIVSLPLAIGDLAQQGDSVTYSYGGETVTRTVRNIERHRLIGTARLTFFDD